MNRLNGKVAIVTGAATGLGLTTVKMFLDEGAYVVATDINKDTLQQNINDLHNENVIALYQDVSDEDNWKKVVEETINKFHHLDILVNNAGYIVGKNVLEETLDEWNKVLSVSATGSFLGIQNCAKVMKNGGSIINISSAAGLRGGPRTGNDAAYNAAKGAERLLTKHSAHTLAPINIRVNSIHPGAIMTDMLKMYIENDPDILNASKPFAPLAPHFADPEQIAYGIIYLASDESKCVTGAELSIDNGLASY